MQTSNFKATFTISPQAPALDVALLYALLVVNTSDNLAAVSGVFAALGLYTAASIWLYTQARVWWVGQADLVTRPPIFQSCRAGTDDSWQAASRCTRDVKHLLLVLAAKLQLALTEGIEHTLYEQCFTSCGAYQQAILRSLSEHSDCSARG